MRLWQTGFSIYKIFSPTGKTAWLNRSVGEGQDAPEDIGINLVDTWDRSHPSDLMKDVMDKGKFMFEHEDGSKVKIFIDENAYHSPNPTTGAALYVLGSVQPGMELFREVAGDGKTRRSMAGGNRPFETGRAFFTQASRRFTRSLSTAAKKRFQPRRLLSIRLLPSRSTRYRQGRTCSLP